MEIKNFPIVTDVSFYQNILATPETIDFYKMNKLSLGTIIRAGQNLWVDRDFKLNWKKAKDAGIPRGSYWFYDSRVPPKRQAELWVSAFPSGDYGEMELWADFEDNYNGAYKGWRHWYDFMENVKGLIPSNKKMGVYTGYYYWLENTISVGIPLASLNSFSQYPLWIANYGAPSPLIPKPWKTWDFWQFTDNGDGSLYGVESKNIDLNYFNGTRDEFFLRYGVVESQPPHQEPEKPPLTGLRPPEISASYNGRIIKYKESI